MAEWNPENLERKHVEAAIRDIDDERVASRFDDSRDYDLLHPNGNVYPPKKVVGIAARHLPEVGRVLRPNECHGGPGSKAFNRLLELGYEICAKGDWTEGQNRRAVRHYARMIRLEAAGKPYSKAEINRQLQAKVLRKRGGIEYKWQNISAVLNERLSAFLPGYAPAANYQQQSGNLAEAVEGIILQDPTLVRALRSFRSSAIKTTIGKQSGKKVQDVLVAPPRSVGTGNAKRKKNGGSRRGDIDWSQLHDEQMRLGADGESFVKAWLEKGGAKVEHVSASEGDHIGYDLRATFPDGEVEFIEVKTTNGGPKTGFIVSSNQVETARMFPHEYWIYRVFHFNSQPKLYRLRLREDSDEYNIAAASFEISF